MDSSALANAEYWLSVIFWVKLSAGLLVAIGVVFEFLGDWASRPYEKVVKEFHELQLKSMQAEADSAKAALVEAQKKITDANLIANNAASDAAKLGVSVGDLHGFVAEKERLNNAAIEDLKKNTAGLDKARNEALEASQKSEKILAAMNTALEKERAMQQQMAPRHISPEQRIDLIKYWEKLDKGPITISAKKFDEEAENFADEIFEVLNAAGFNAKRGDDPMSFTLQGQWIVVRNLDKFTKEKSYLGNIQFGLKTILKIDFDGQQMNSSYPSGVGDVVLAIGAKKIELPESYKTP